MPAIDDVLPRFDAHEVHSIPLALEPSRAIALALSTPVTADPVVGALFRLRGLRAGGTIEDALMRLGFARVLAGEGEVVFAASGTPWRLRGGIRPFDSAGPGEVQVATDLRADGASLTTETRILALDAAARRSFLRYWRVVGPFSALIRRRWLRQIAAGAR